MTRPAVSARIAPGPASGRLADLISHHLDGEPIPCTVHRFPDGFAAHWVRLKLDAAATATAWFTYE